MRSPWCQTPSSYLPEVNHDKSHGLIQYFGHGGIYDFLLMWLPMQILTINPKID
jgi:hypothetical protein